MYLGSTAPVGIAKPRVTSSPKTPPFVFPIPGLNAPITPAPANYVELLKTTNPAKPDDLDEVVVTAKRISTPVEEDLPEITVSAKRIQWWQWLAGGAVAVLLVNELRS